MFKRTIFALAVAAVAYGGSLQAQENATLTLRSGERISAQLLDHGGVGFTIRINGQDRIIPQNDVAVIDFTGGTMNAADWAKVTAGQHVIWLRNGETIAEPTIRIDHRSFVDCGVRTSHLVDDV